MSRLGHGGVEKYQSNELVIRKKADLNMKRSREKCSLKSYNNNTIVKYKNVFA